MAVAERATRDDEIPFWALGAAAIGVALAIRAPNEGLTIAAIGSLAAVLLLLRRRKEPAALLFIFGMQWLQGSMKVIHADVLGVELRTLARLRSIDAAVYLTLAWVVALAVGARIAVSGFARATPNRPTASMSLRRLLVLYAAWTVSAIVLQTIASGGMRQFVLAFANMRWAVVFAIFVVAIKTGRGLPFMWGIFAFEVGSGFLSFFSDFKVPLFLLVLAALSAGQRFTLRQLPLIFAGSLVTLYLGVVWSAIKMDYRERLNEETGGQVVSIGKEAQVRELIALLGTVDSEVLDAGFAKLAERVAYVDYFGYTLDFVPAIRRHEGGKLWLAAIEHIVMPRLLFPDKASLPSDTLITSLYTGLSLDRYGRDTSITIGLPALTYVDFGPVFMFVVAILVGLLHGGAYGYFASRAPGEPLAHGFATAVVIQHTSVGSSADKVLGGQVTTFVIALLLWKFMSAVLAWLAPQRGIVAGEGPGE